MAIAAVPAVALLVMVQAVFGQGIEPPAKKTSEMIKSVRAIRENPRMLERLRDQTMQEVKDIYGDFVKEERLSAQQTKRFYELFVDAAVQLFFEDAEQMEKITEGKGPPPERSPSRMPEVNRQLELLLGDTATDHLAKYQKKGTERLILAQYRHELRMSDIALPDDTAKTLFKIMCEERARTPPLPFDPRNANGNFHKALEGDNAERYFEAEADVCRRILSRAGTVLDQEQYEALAKFQERQLSVDKGGIEAMRRAMQPSQRESSESP